MGCYIGSDIGTTGTKTVVIEEKGKVLGKSMVEHPLSTPKSGLAEHREDQRLAVCLGKGNTR